MDYSTIVLGILASLILIEATGLYPGGLIVPMYLVRYVENPLRLCMTVIISLCTLGVYRIISGRMLIFGRRRFVFMVATSALLSVVFNGFIPFSHIMPFDLRVIGISIPGLIANNFEKQGIVNTICAMVIATALLFIMMDCLAVLR